MAAGQALDLAVNYFAGIVTAWRTPEEVSTPGPNGSPVSDAARQDKPPGIFGGAGPAGLSFNRWSIAAVGAAVVLLVAAGLQDDPRRSAHCSSGLMSASNAVDMEDFDAVCKSLGCAVIGGGTPPAGVNAALASRGRQALRVAEALQRRIADLTEKIKALRRTADPTAKQTQPQQRFAAIKPSIAVFRELATFEPAARMTLTSIASYAEALREQALTGDWAASEELEKLPVARGGLRARLLEAVREARTLAPMLPLAKSAEAGKVLTCNPGLLLEMENLATAAGGDVGGPMPGEDDAAARFGLGLYLSEIGVSTDDLVTPFFDATDANGGLGVTAIRALSSAVSWVADSRGSHVPAAIARAEELLQQGEEGSVGQERGDRAAARALRLYRHAKLLVSKHHDSAAEWRYQTAASLALEHGREKLAAHALTRLGYFLMLRGRQREALNAAGDALAIHADPLARYLTATLRRTLGELHSTEDVLNAQRELVEIRGTLPSKDLERLRAAAETDLEVWGHVTAALGAMQTGQPAPDRPSVGFFRATCACLTTGDASQTLICLAGWCLFC